MFLINFLNTIFKINLRRIFIYNNSFYQRNTIKKIH